MTHTLKKSNTINDDSVQVHSGFATKSERNNETIQITKSFPGLIPEGNQKEPPNSRNTATNKLSAPKEKCFHE